MRDFAEDLREAAAYHGHLCSGQVIGVRMARLGAQLLGLGDPRECRDLAVYVETDRCIADAVGTVTGCRIGHRRLKWFDYGKSAAAFLNFETGEAYRIYRKYEQFPGEGADLVAFYSEIPDGDLFEIQKVNIPFRPQDRPGKPMEAVHCARCGEEVLDGRQVERKGENLCRPCAESGYYTIA
ncbi:MAG: FmdE family protein [Clostridiales Family XIII bacterium]|jgi:formylmethanofuran dehydrogenase subunit E|nr:FmdE family protein [Clostridiales Family XIII bacterium]